MIMDNRIMTAAVVESKTFPKLGESAGPLPRFDAAHKPVGDGSDYIAALQFLKSTFHGGDEGNAVVNAILANIPRGPLKLLDIGCGDGSFVRRTATELRRLGRFSDLTAIDPLAAAVRATQLKIPNARLLQLRFEEYVSEEPFDVINVRHSIYYVEDVGRQLRRMHHKLSPGGIVVFTLWTRECDLFRAYDATRRDGEDPSVKVAAEDLLDLLTKSGLFATVESRTFPGDIRLDRWTSSNEALEQVYLVLCRTIRTRPTRAELDRFRSRLQSRPLTGRRVGAVITCAKLQ